MVRLSPGTVGSHMRLGWPSGLCCCFVCSLLDAGLRVRLVRLILEFGRAQQSIESSLRRIVLCAVLQLGRVVRFPTWLCLGTCYDPIWLQVNLC